MTVDSSIHTIGHSTRLLKDLIDLLHENRIQSLVDIRRYPASRRHPQFNRDALESTIPKALIQYSWLPALGGRRAARKDSHNTAWRNAGFRGYADYMETEPFEKAITSLLADARERSIAIMCAEQAWQQCHRGLSSDYLKVRGVEVVHILGKNRTEKHPWTAAARVIDGKLSYEQTEPPGQRDQPGFVF